MGLFSGKCPECGAALKINENAKGKSLCPYCESEYLVEKSVINVNNKTNNLYKANYKSDPTDWRNRFYYSLCRLDDEDFEEFFKEEIKYTINYLFLTEKVEKGIDEIYLAVKDKKNNYDNWKMLIIYLVININEKLTSDLEKSVPVIELNKLFVQLVDSDTAFDNKEEVMSKANKIVNDGKMKDRLECDNLKEKEKKNNETGHPILTFFNYCIIFIIVLIHLGFVLYGLFLLIHG